MNKKSTYTNLFRLFQNASLMLLVILLLSNEARSQNASLSVIGNKIGCPSALKTSELKSIFRGEKQRWNNGTKICIALLKTNTTSGKSMCKKVYDMSGDELNKFWLALVFQGKAEAPVFLNSSAEIENFVAQNPGSIGIVDQATENAEVKIITVNGQKSF